MFSQKKRNNRDIVPLQVIIITLKLCLIIQHEDEIVNISTRIFLRKCELIFKKIKNDRHIIIDGL